jgi:cyclophilin family peptidyl-prolyl cis-trans isomerase
MKLIKGFSLLLIVIGLSGFFKVKPIEYLIFVNHSQAGPCGVFENCVEIQYLDNLDDPIDSDALQPFTQLIEGFKYNSGYSYVLKIRKTKLKKKEAKEDGHRYKYELVEIIRQDLNIKEEGLYAKVSTSMGDIYGKLEYKKAPLTVANFVGLAEGDIPNSSRAKGVPYYDSLIFHRVIPNFMIQGGDPKGVGSGGPGYAFKNETETGLTHKVGTFSMANSGPNTNGSQFFITHRATPWLDGGYNIFGYVISGQEVVTAIGNTPRSGADRPNNPVYMKSVTIIRIGQDAKNFDALTTFNSLK